MNSIRISAKRFVEDIRSGMGDAAIMEKYCLSARSLPKVKEELMRRGLLAPADVKSTNGCPISDKISIKVKEFVRLFRESSDDFVMMSTYSLTPKQLEQIYRQLIAKGLLSEYEFHSRERRSPELQEMELLEPDETTAVDFTEEFSGRLRDYEKIGAFRPNADWLKKSTSVTDGLSRDVDPARVAHARRDAPGLGPCPRCGKPKHPESPDSCLHCGVVFSKLKSDSKRNGVAIWE